MFCVKCGSKLERTWGHCSNCGTKIEQSQTPTISVTESTYKTNSPKFKLGCGGIVLVLIAAGLISSAFSPRQNDASEPSQSPTVNERQKLNLEEAIDLALGANSSAQQLAKLNCGQFDAYTPEYFERLSKEIPAALPNYKKVKEPRKALAFVQDNELQLANFLSDYQETFKNGINAILKVVEDEIDFKIYVKGEEDWDEAMGAAILQECKSMAQYPVVLESITELQAELDRVRKLSQNVPWYPEGFEQISLNANFAYQNVRGYCQLGDSCARFKIVSKVSCQSLYIEVNFLNSAGEIVDWGNELLTLPANTVALIDIGTFSNISSWQMTKLSCN